MSSETVRDGEGRPPVERFVGLRSMAEQLGGARWWALALWSRLGEWATDEPDDAARVLFTTLSHHQAEYAEVLTRRLPVSAAFDLDSLTSPRPGDEARLAVGAADTAARVRRVAGVYLPVAAVALRSTLALCGTTAEAATARSLRLVLAGLAEDRDAIDGLAARLDLLG